MRPPAGATWFSRRCEASSGHGADAPPHHEDSKSKETTMGKLEVVTDAPRYIKLNARDNVAIVVNDFGLPAGTRFPCGLTLRAFVPQGHKTALVDLDEGAPILRYGE